MDDKTSELHTMRNAHAGATRRAARAWALIEQLRAKRLLVPVDTVLNRVAEAVYFSGRYDASERYETIGEFKESLIEDLNGAFERAELDGVPHFVIKPFFAKNTDFLHHMGIGYVQGYCSAEELAGLNVAPLGESKSTVVAGLTDAEMDVLIAHHRRSTLTLVNLMRKCATALHYMRTGLENKHNTAPVYLEAVKEKDIEGLVTELGRLVELPFSPAPSNHFGTEADKVNVLRVLPTGPGLSVLLGEPALA